MINFLFWIFFLGIGIASLQDLKRREVDNWLNLLLLVSGLGFIFLNAIFNWDYSGIVFACSSLFVLFILANLFYYGRVFAGGDAKLLFAMAALFVAGSFNGTMINIAIFTVLLMFSGSLYGLFYGGYLFFRNFKANKKETKRNMNNYFYLVLFSGIFLCLIGILFNILLFFGIFILLGDFLVVVAKAIEKSMIKEKNPEDLREGDWLVKSVSVKGKIIKAAWEGLSLEDIELLKKNKKRVFIKDGIPFVPAFFIALIAYGFKEVILSWIVGII